MPSIKIRSEQCSFICNQVFHPYWKWEDWKHGIHKSRCRKLFVDKSIQVLSSQETFMKAMKEMFRDWKYACEQNLTNNSRNRLSFLGQAACCYNHGATIPETTSAWWQLNQDQRDNANNTASNFIQQYEQKIHRTIGL